MVDARIQTVVQSITAKLGSALGQMGAPNPYAGQAPVPTNPYRGGLFAQSPYGAGFDATSPYGEAMKATSPYKGGSQVANPYQGQGLRPTDPYQGAPGGLFAASPYAGQGLNVTQPKSGTIAPTLYYTSGAKAAAAARQYSPQTGATPRTGSRGGPLTGMDSAISQWDNQAQQTFGPYADVMLAIMMNESGGSPTAYNPAGDAWGLFQQVGLGSNDPNTQFAAAKKLLDDKLAGITTAYAKNGLNPDERTRARDIALAWAGHFDYATGQPNPSSTDIGSGQTAAQLSEIFLANYDKVQAARQAATAGGAPYQGAAGGMQSIWGDAQPKINQEYGVVDPSVNQNIYTYGREYGLPQGHTGLDIGLARGSNLYMPAGLSGTVEIAGGTPYFRDEDYGDQGTPGKGELRIVLDNGDILILGHTSQIGVQPGQRVTGGQLVGQSGSASGDHLHLEVRRKLANGGYQLVNPHEYFG